MASSLLCENLGASKFRRMFANEIMGDAASSATIKDLFIQAQNNVIIKPNGGLGPNASKAVSVLGDASVTGTLSVNGLAGLSGSMAIENITFQDSAMTASDNVMSLHGAVSVQVEDVLFTDNQMHPTTDVDLVLSGGATKSVLVEGVKVTDNTVSTSSGALDIVSASGTVNVESVSFTGGAVNTTAGGLTLASTAGTVKVSDVVFTNSALTVLTDADISLTAGATKSVILENVTVKDNAINTSSGALTLASTAGTVQVESVIFTGAALTASSDVDVSVTAGATKSVLLENVKVTDNTVSTSANSLSLTSAAGTVAVENVTFTDSALTTADNVMSFDAAVSVNVKKDLVLTSTAGGAGKITSSAGTLELTSASGVVKITGELQVDGPVNSVTTTETNLRIEDKTVTIANGATDNTKGDAGGLVVAGNAGYGSRAMTWHMGAGETSQDKGDYTGSYWHLEGGQLMLSRVIAEADRTAPGTTVLLSTLASGSDDARWEFTSGATSEVGSKVFTLNGGASVSSGVLKVNASGTQTATCGSAMPTGTFTVISKVAPQADLSLASADGLVILSYAGADATTTVSVTNSGHLTVTDGTTPVQSASVLLSKDAFSVALVRDGTNTTLYFNGTSVAVISASVDVGASPVLTLGPGKNQAGYAVWFDDVRVKASAITSGNTQLYGWKEMYAEPQTVTYGFRVGNDESLQLVKTRGSGSASRALTFPAPNTVTDSNDMGTIGDSTLAIVTESLN